MKHALTRLLCLSLCLCVFQLGAQVIVTGASVDGTALNLPLGSASATNRTEMLKIPPGTKDLQFTVDGSALKLSQPYRLRYKLEGFDANWIEIYSYMRTVVRILDARNTIIAAADFKAGHESPGWKGSVEKSQFTPCHGEMTAPPRAAKVQIWCGSGGPEITLGILAFRNVVVRVGEPGEEFFREVKYSTDTGVELDLPLGSLTDWRRDGSRPEMAQVLRLDQADARHVLVLRDADPENFAAWLVPREKCVPVRPGQRVSVDWESCHAVGSSGPGSIGYQRLPPGNYWLRVAAMDLAGAPVAAELSLPFIVLTPIWSRWWFWVVVGGGGCLGGFWVTRRIMKGRLQLALDLAKRQQMVERERTRIARDIHDDLGTSLTQISMLSESARDNPGNPSKTVSELDRICTVVRESTQAMDEIVWAADPENDSLDELATYISGFTQELLGGVGVRCRLEMPASFPCTVLSSEVRHNVFLTCKEALNNALKHGQPQEVRVKMFMEANRFVLAVSDDGCGFTLPNSSGHGLANMKQRVEKLGGRFTLASTPGSGTRVSLEVPVNPAAGIKSRGGVHPNDDM